MKYKVFADKETSAAYAASQLRSDITDDEDSAVVLIARDDPCLDESFVRHNLGEVPAMDERIAPKITRIMIRIIPISIALIANQPIFLSV
jgi:threonine synthase